MGALVGAAVDTIGALVLGSCVGRGVAILTGDNVGAFDRGSTGVLIEAVGALDGAFEDTFGALVLGNFVGRGVAIAVGDNVGALV